MICVRVFHTVKWIVSSWGYCLKGEANLTLELSCVMCQMHGLNFLIFCLLTNGVDYAVGLHCFQALQYHVPKNNGAIENRQSISILQ